MSGIAFMIGSLFGLVLALAIYFAPTGIALKRKHHNALPIFVLNLLLGWSFVGWAVALVWALARPTSRD